MGFFPGALLQGVVASGMVEQDQVVLVQAWRGHGSLAGRVVVAVAVKLKAEIL